MLNPFEGFGVGTDGGEDVCMKDPIHPFIIKMKVAG